MSESSITLAELQRILGYDPWSGRFWWKTKHSRKVVPGSAAGCRTDRYVLIGINGRIYHGHRLAWFYFYGKWPKEIDHINGMSQDNRIENLRDVCHSANLKNKKRQTTNTSGCTGVHWSSQKNKWQATVYVDKRLRHVGFYTYKDDAIVARKAAEKKYGYHPNHDRVTST